MVESDRTLIEHKLDKILKKMEKTDGDMSKVLKILGDMNSKMSKQDIISSVRMAKSKVTSSAVTSSVSSQIIKCNMKKFAQISSC